jgi:hypothetical protein
MKKAAAMRWFAELDFAQFPMRIATHRYTSQAFQDREREAIWMRVWQVAGGQIRHLDIYPQMPMPSKEMLTSSETVATSA